MLTVEYCESAMMGSGNACGRCGLLEVEHRLRGAKRIEQFHFLRWRPAMSIGPVGSYEKNGKSIGGFRLTSRPKNFAYSSSRKIEVNNDVRARGQWDSSRARKIL